MLHLISCLFSERYCKVTPAFAECLAKTDQMMAPFSKDLPLEYRVDIPVITFIQKCVHIQAKVKGIFWYVNLGFHHLLQELQMHDFDKSCSLIFTKFLKF